jgi:HTH-type transcriptional regulator, competence development regulator
MTPFSLKLRSLRESRGALQKSLAERLGIGASYLSALEQGRKVPPKNIAFFDRLQKSLDLTDQEIHDLRESASATELLGPFANGASPMQLEMLLNLANRLKQLQPSHVRAINAILDMVRPLSNAI